MLKRKKANGHGTSRREGLKEAETPESRLVEDEEDEGEKERDWVAWGNIRRGSAARGGSGPRARRARGACVSRRGGGRDGG